MILLTIARLNLVLRKNAVVLNFYIINIKLLELCNRVENCLWKIFRNTQEDKIEVKDFKLKGKGLIAKVPYPKLSFF